VIVSVALSDAIAPPAVPTLKTPMTLPFPLIIDKLLTETSQLLIMKARPKIACQQELIGIGICFVTVAENSLF
jgi:hypothetical protein